ncbi:M28 family peptidase [Pseudalkalibacillus decolorationis]|uniref:M28 family peptidase n=1 Tax=Pseudalkalibacillus decolorationis TaxID=163879 RepID=UPI002148C101|nr:M28 family peptidase [Pseudalkalibacillus decolorationis]
MKKKPILSLTLAATLSIGTLGTGATFAKPMDSVQAPPIHVVDHKVINKISAENIYQTIKHLSQQPRVAGTESEDQAVQYIKEKFESYGYDTEIQEFTFVGYTAPHTVELSIDGSDEEFQPETFTYTVSGEVTGGLTYAGLGTKDDVESVDLTGKIALIKRGSITFAEKVLNAAEKGAVGVIIYNNAEGSLSGTLGEASEDYVPAVSVTKAQGEALTAKLENGESLTATINVQGASTGEKTSHNVIATKEPTKPTRANDDYIMVVGSHHDSVAGAPGANDDASGTAMTLELARVYKDLPTDTELRFVTFGAEEIGLLGSSHYVASLSDDEINRTVANFNLDMVGSKDAGDLVMRTLDGEPNLVTHLAQASSKRLNGVATSYGQGGRSDHVPFAEAGIPAALFIHSPTEPWYHSPEDTIDKISKEKLQDVAEIVGGAIYYVAKFDSMGPKPKAPKKQKAEQELYHEQNMK